MPSSQIFVIYRKKRRGRHRNHHERLISIMTIRLKSISNKLKLYSLMTICLFISLAQHDKITQVSALLSPAGGSSSSINTSSTVSQHPVHYGNMSSMMLRNNPSPMTNSSLNTLNQSTSNSTNKALVTAASSELGIKTAPHNQHEVTTPLNQQQSRAGPTNSPAINSRLKQQVVRQQQQQVEPGTPTGQQRQRSDNQHMSATDIHDSKSSMNPSANQAISNFEQKQSEKRIQSSKVSSVDIRGTDSSLSASKGSSNVRNQQLPWFAQQQATISSSPSSASMRGNSIIASGKIHTPSGQLNIYQQQVAEPAHQITQQRYTNSRTVIPHEQVSEPLDSLQLEKPNGYSYESSSSPGASYTHTSPLSPARQEVLQAEQIPPSKVGQSRQQNLASMASSHYDRSAHSIFDSAPRFMSSSEVAQIEQFSASKTSPTISTSSQVSYANYPASINQQRTITSAPTSSYSMMPVPQQSITGTVNNPCKPARGLQQLAQDIPQVNEFGSSNGLPTPLAIPNFSSSTAASLSSSTTISAKYLRLSGGTRLRSQYIFKVIRADSLTDCESACSRASALAANNPHETCRSFNYRAHFMAENCELSRHDSRMLKLEDSSQFEQHTQFDFYALDPNSVAQVANQQQQLLLAASSNSLVYSPFPEPDCLDVSQSCSQDGLEFTLRTNEPFNGRIYTYGYYDSCFVDGEGSTTSVLRISRSNGFPRCGTQQIGDLMTNIVVVQFNDYVQTTRDKKYNLTCYFSGPGEAVVTSNYLDTKLDERTHPMQIEYLPPQNVITSNVHLKVLYRGQPTNTIALGDLLTFRLETKSIQPLLLRQQQYRGAASETGALGKSEIFATNVIAKDPYSGRQVQLIDSRGCPIDSVNVFPELQRTPDGALESEFYAFKIPDSNFLIFQATVRTCKAPCEPVICQHPITQSHSNEPTAHAEYVQQATSGGVKGGGGSLMSGSYLMSGGQSHLSSVPSWGKKRRRRRRSTASISNDYDDEMLANAEESVEHIIPVRFSSNSEQVLSGELNPSTVEKQRVRSLRRPELTEPEEEVKEMFRVYMSRAEINRQQQQQQQQQQRERQVLLDNQEDSLHSGKGGISNITTVDLNLLSSSAPAPTFKVADAAAATATATSDPEHLDDSTARVREQICMSLGGYYVMLFSVISLSMVMVSVLFVSLFITRRAKFHITSTT